MIPSELVRKLDELAYFFGGAKEVVKIVPESRLLDLLTFGGPVGTISPFLGLDQESFNTYPLHSLNLEAVGYEGGRYTVLNVEKKKLYSEECRTNSRGDWVFGLSEADRSLLQRASHGEYFYLYFEGKSGPQLVIVWVCKLLPRQIVEEVLVRWEQLKEVCQPKLVYNEMYLDLSEVPSPSVLKMAQVQGTAQSRLTREKTKLLALKGEGDLTSIEVDIYLSAAYIRFKTSRWTCLWCEVTDSVTGLVSEIPVKLTSVSGVGSDRLKEALDNLYYIRGVNAGGSWLFSTGSPGSSVVVGNSFESSYTRVFAKAELVEAS